MNKNYVENSLKRFLKRKVKITLGMVVAFLITGAVGFAETINDPIRGTKGEILEVIIGSEEYKPDENGIYTVKSYKDGDGYNQIVAVEHAKVTLNEGNTLKINLTQNEQKPNITYYGIRNASVTGKGNIVIDVKETGINFKAVGIQASSDKEMAIDVNDITISVSRNNLLEATIYNADDKGNKLNIKANNIVIGGTENRVGYGIVGKEGTITNIDCNNLEIYSWNSSIDLKKVWEDKERILNITATENIKLNAYRQGGNTVSLTGASVNIKGKNIEIKSTNTETSNIGSNIVLSMESSNLNIDAEKSINIIQNAFNNKKSGYAISVTDGELNINKNKIEGSEEYNPDVNITGNIKLTKTGKLNAKLSGTDSLLNGKIETANTAESNIDFLDGAKWDNTGNSSVTNLNIGNSSVVDTARNIKILKALTNAGTINLSNKTTVELGANSTFTNEKGGILNVESGATAVSGEGTAINSGTINLADTDNSDGTLSKLLNGGTLNNQGVIVLGDKTGTMSDDDWKGLLSEIVTGDGTFTNSGMIVDKENNTIFADGTVINGDTTVGNISDNGSIKIEGDVTISGTAEDKLTDVTINADGNLTLAGKDDIEGSAGVVVDEKSEINVSKDKTVTVTGSENKLDGNINLVDNGKLEIAENSQTTIGGTVSQSSGEGGSIVNKGDLIIEDAEIKVGITPDENNSTGKVTITDSIVEEVKANEIQVGKEEITDDFWNMFNGTKKLSLLADGTETENSHSVINKDIVSDTSLFISEDSVYNGNVVVNGTADNNTLAIMNSDVEFNKDVTVKNTKGILVGGTGNSSALVKFGGNVKADKISFAGEAEAYYSADSTLVNNAGTDGTIINGGKNTFEVGDNGKNALLNTSNLADVTTGVTVNGSEILLDVNLTKDEVIDLGEKSVIGDNNTIALTENSETFYELTETGDNKYKFAYKDDLATENGFSEELNEIFKNSQTIHDVLNKSGYDTVEKRAEVLDKYYSANIYSETVKAAYNNVKLNEEAVESLARKSEIGKWTAEGKALYSKNEYDRKGTVGDYSSEIESTGLMAAFGYGVNETTTAGIAFSGVKQDVDTDGGSADADLFYLGVYGNKVVGNYDFTAGLGNRKEKL